MTTIESRPAHEVAALSNRELEVLVLMAEGLSNCAIAAQLIVSLKTVESVSAAVFRKLNLTENSEVNRRVKAAVLYHRHLISADTSSP
jgi:DNA-binding NarL/FixJ family response regulator